MKAIVRVVLMVVIVGAVVLGGRWYLYVSNTETPYDEVGIELNSRMPGPIRQWGCARLETTFAGALPPYGCQAADGRSWI
mgnify:FL=1